MEDKGFFPGVGWSRIILAAATPFPAGRVFPSSDSHALTLGRKGAGRNPFLKLSCISHLPLKMILGLKCRILISFTRYPTFASPWPIQQMERQTTALLRAVSSYIVFSLLPTSHFPLNTLDPGERSQSEDWAFISLCPVYTRGGPHSF